MGINSNVAGASPRRAVFLDRDGTLNRAYERDGVSIPPASEEQLEILPGVPRALALLRAAGFVLVVVTNQPDVARGTLERRVAEGINARLREQLEVDALLCCYHDDADDCGCRKPRPGMLLQAADELNLDLSASFMVGDRWRDTGAGKAAGCVTIQLGASTPAGRTRPDYVAASVPAAAAIILKQLTAG